MFQITRMGQEYNFTSNEVGYYLVVRHGVSTQETRINLAPSQGKLLMSWMRSVNQTAQRPQPAAEQQDDSGFGMGLADIEG